MIFDALAVGRKAELCKSHRNEPRLEPIVPAVMGLLLGVLLLQIGIWWFD
jgi:hypothetical protein